MYQEEDTSSLDELSPQETSEEVLLTESELDEKLKDTEYLQNALESLQDIALTVGQDPNYNIVQVKQRLRSVYDTIGLETISLESVDNFDRKVATETILDNIRDGFSRIMNLFLSIDDFIGRKLLWGFKSFKNLVTMIGSDVEDAIQNAQQLPTSTKEIISIKKSIGTHLRTPDNKDLNFQYADEIITNHINILDGFLRQKELVSILHGEDLDYFRRVTSHAIAGKKTVSGDIEKRKKDLASEMTNIFTYYKNFRGKPLANGKTLYVEFDKDAPDRLIFYKDMFQMNIVSAHRTTRPFDAKRLNKSEGQKLAAKIKRLHSLYKEVDDYTAHITFLRQQLYKLYTAQIFVVPASMIVLGPFLAAIISLGISIASFINQILQLIKLVGYTASSLSYYAIREGCNYIKASL